MKNFFAFVLLLLSALPAFAVEPGEMLSDPALEARAAALSHQLRCLVCQGQDIDSSEAELAADLRRLVRERIKAGDSDAQVLEYLQSRYGDYVLMKPPVAPRTAVLWLAPFLTVAGGLAAMRLFLGKRKGDA